MQDERRDDRPRKCAEEEHKEEAPALCAGCGRETTGDKPICDRCLTMSW